MFRGVTSAVWLWLCNFVFYAFGSVRGYISRFQAAEDSEKNGESFPFVGSHKEDKVGEETEENGGRENGGDAISESNGDEDYDGDEEDSVFVESASSKYQFLTAREISGYMEQPRVMSFQEMFVDSSDHGTVLLGHREEEEEETEAREQDNDHVEKDDSVPWESIFKEKKEEEVLDDHEDLQRTEKVEILESEDEFLDEDAFLDEAEIISEDCSSQVGLELESICSEDVNRIVGTAESVHNLSHEVLSEDDGERSQPGNDTAIDVEVEDVNCKERISESDETDFSDDGEAKLDSGPAFYGDYQPCDSDEDYIEVEFWQRSFSDARASSPKSLVEEDDYETEYSEVRNTEAMNYLENSHEFEGVQQKSSVSASASASASYSENELDFNWEHDDIVEQLKMELKNVRTGGLPTIFEESESDSPQMATTTTTIADLRLKPLKIDQKLELKDRMQEIQKVYKSYAEKMRKLDILNYQTLHAIGLLQLKDPLSSSASWRPSAQVNKFLLRQSWANKLRRPKIDSVVESMVALHRDLEIVYVGHVCLSWEILQWQYGKARELKEFDSGGFRWYNHVAGEFQLFQVLVRRFIEDEPFQRPRIEYYVKNRCVVRALLQVPALKDDCSRADKSKMGNEDTISIDALVEIMEESLRTLWDFVRADKHDHSGGFKQIHLDHQDSADLELLMSLRTQLQKKERRLKDIVRSGNCIVKRFQKHQDRLDHATLFAQVELRLVSRVLNMPKITRDQLVWCREKLDRINFVSRKISVEPSFLLFP